MLVVGRLEESACLAVKNIGKPYEGKSHARFDEGGRETTKGRTEFFNQLSDCNADRVISSAPHILWQDFLDIQDRVFYTSFHEKQVLLNGCTPTRVVESASHTSPGDI
jgi:hypothetical protein